MPDLVPIPPSLDARPKHGGLPIPFVTAVIDGVPDFRVHDEDNRARCAIRALCQLCGVPLLGPEGVLIGFAGSVERNSFGEPPMHRDCFQYAWQVCPWLNGRAYQVRDGDGNTKWLERPPDGGPLGIIFAPAWSTDMDRHGQLVWHRDPAPEPWQVEWRTR